MKLIRLIDEELGDSYIIEVEEKKFDKAKKFINELIGKWYGNKNDYYSNKYYNIIDFIECKLAKSNIKYDIPVIDNLYY